MGIAHGRIVTGGPCHTGRVPSPVRFTTAEASARSLLAIRRLLDDAFEGDFTDDDWEHALGGCHVVVAEGDSVVAHASVVARPIEVAGTGFQAGYVEAVATAPGRRRRGLGALVVAEVGDVIRNEFELGVLSTASHSFYRRAGWESWRGPTYVRHGDDLVRSSEDDDGVMVLRFGPSEAVDLTAPIVCETRSGDDW